MDLLKTLKGSLLESIIPEGWNLAKMDACIGDPATATERQAHWHEDFLPVPCESLEDFNTYMGHEIAMQILAARNEGKKLIMIFPVGPMGMYKWAVFFLKSWNTACDHVYGFNMDEWSDYEGNTLPPDNPGSFRYAMEHAFYNPLGDLTVPVNQRHFATKDALPAYVENIAALRAQNSKMVLVHGVGRVFHIAFWEPHFASEFSTEREWREQTHRLGAKLHPFTVEQNALTSFKSRTTLVSAAANTIGPAIFLAADTIIGGCDGAFGRGMMWQGLSLWVTLRYQPDIWVPSSFMPTMPGKLFYLAELAGPLTAECN